MARPLGKPRSCHFTALGKAAEFKENQAILPLPQALAAASPATFPNFFLPPPTSCLTWNWPVRRIKKRGAEPPRVAARFASCDFSPARDAPTLLARHIDSLRGRMRFLPRFAVGTIQPAAR